MGTYLWGRVVNERGAFKNDFHFLKFTFFKKGGNLQIDICNKSIVKFPGFPVLNCSLNMKHRGLKLIDFN